MLPGSFHSVRGVFHSSHPTIQYTLAFNGISQESYIVISHVEAGLVEIVVLRRTSDTETHPSGWENTQYQSEMLLSSLFSVESTIHYWCSV